MKQTAVEWLTEELRVQFGFAFSNNILEQAIEMEKEQQSKFTIDFINWLHLNQYKYNPKAKFYQKHFINETLFFINLILLYVVDQ
jgi:hypothetical protein